MKIVVECKRMKTELHLNSSNLQLIESILLAHLLCLLFRHSAVSNIQSLQTVSESKTVRNGFKQVLESLRVNSPVSVGYVSRVMHIKILNVGRVQLVSEVELAVQRDRRYLNVQAFNVSGRDHQTLEVFN